MEKAEFKVRSASDPKLAEHATSPHPAWLWSIDGTRVIWANPVGAALFCASSAASLGIRTFGPADPHRRQVVQLANRLPAGGAIRMERLRGFGAALGSLATCACARLDFADGGQGVLIVNAGPATRKMPLVERLQRLVAEADEQVAAFDADGYFVAASPTATTLLGLPTLAEAGLEPARLVAMKEGHAEASFGAGQLTLQRVGNRSDLGLLAFIAPEPTQDMHIPLMDAFSDELPAAEVPNGPAEAISAHDATEQSDKRDSPVDERSHASLQGAVSLELRRAPPRRHPLRFMWQMDADGRFSLGSDAFTRLIGVNTAAGFGRPWREIADAFGFDPEGLVLEAVATREAWSGITLNWPVDDGSHLPIELSGLPIHDAAKVFIGYRGFGICRELEGLARLDAVRSQEFFNDPPSADMILTEIGPAVAATWPREPLQLLAVPDVTGAAARRRQAETAQPADPGPPLDTDEEMPSPTRPNVIPFRQPGDPPAPVLTAVENSAFNELARQLSARLEGETGFRDPTEVQAAAVPPAEPSVSAIGVETPAWLGETEPPARGESRRGKALFDLLSTGVLIYRLDRLLYANRAFLERTGYDSLHALEQEGGLDALYVEPGVSNASNASDTGTPVTIAASHGATVSTSPIAARLHTISWDEDIAHALIFSSAATEVPATAQSQTPSGPALVLQPSAAGHARAEELATILDTITDGILMFDAAGQINASNRGAETLFGHGGADLVQQNIATLFAPESRPVVEQYLESVKGIEVASLLEHGHEVLGQTQRAGTIPLSMTMGRTLAGGANFFAVFRDLTPLKTGEAEPHEASQLAESAANARAELLARISREIRRPLDAIIGLADTMIGEGFGAPGNERHVEQLKDVRAFGEKMIAVLDDLANPGRVETGGRDLAFANQNLNDVVESCVAVMQPQASRERIIIRTSLAHTLPPVVADARALRQITMNLIGNSIHLANTGGQVIVSTALTDLGDVALRIRDTGQGLNDNEVAAAMEPFRGAIPPDQSPESGASLSLTKALVEANRAQFNIKTGTHSGTLVEVVFSKAIAKAGA